jgi:uncharacterized protein (TIGR00369 family)
MITSDQQVSVEKALFPDPQLPWRILEARGEFSHLVGPLWILDILDGVGETLRLGFRVGAQHCNLHGVCHGGMLATVADQAMGLGAGSRSEGPLATATISLSIDFLRPAKLGDWVESRTKVVRETRNLLFSEGALLVGEQSVVRMNAIFRR